MNMEGVKTLLNDLGNLLLDTETSDVVLLCQGEEIRAHKLILSARSPVFRAIRIESLNYDNALEVGIFAETHNADGLLEECVQFILNNVPNSLNKDWKETIKESPRMMVKIIDNIFKTYIESRVFELKRKGTLDFSWSNDGYVNAVAFQVDAKVQLYGIGMYGSKYDDHLYAVKFKIVDDASQCIFEESRQYKSNGTTAPIKLSFSNTILEANTKYHIIAEGIDGQTYKGNYSSSSYCLDSFRVTFYESNHHTTGDKSSVFGQFPEFYFSGKDTTLQCK